MSTWHDPRPEIDRFWAEWPALRHRIEEHDESGVTTDLPQLINAAVGAISPELSWELGVADGERELVVTALGDPDLRSTAERWLRAAPAPHPGWQFNCYRQASLDELAREFQFDGREVDLELVRFGVDPDPELARIGVTVCHPDFSSLDDEAQLQLQFIALDRAVGEHDVIRWLADNGTSDRCPENAVTASGLRAAVEGFAANHSTTDIILLEPTFVAGLPLMTLTFIPMRPIDYPLYDQHIAVRVPYNATSPDRLPDADTVPRLRDFEFELMPRLAGHAVLAGHETYDGHRVLHLYADPATDTAQRVADSLPQWPQGTPEITVTIDPAWAEVEHFLM